MNRLSVVVVGLALCVSSSVWAQDPTPQQIYQERVKAIRWENLSIEFRPVTAESVKDAQPMIVESTDQEKGKTYYVGKSEVLTLKDIANIDVSYNPNDADLLRLIIRFNKDARKTLQDYTTAHLGEMMGVVIDGHLRLVAHIRQPLVNGKVQVYGFAAAEAVDIAQRYYKPKLELAKQIQLEQGGK